MPTHATLRRRAQRLIGGLALPAATSSMQQILEAVEQHTGRPIRLVAMSDPMGSGSWWPTDQNDWVFHESRTVGHHQDHIVAHELGHIVFGHEVSDLAEDGALTGSLLAGSAAHRMFRRNYDIPQEREAELFASLLMCRLSDAARRTSRASTSRAVGSALTPHHLRTHAALRALFPLWADLCRQFPDIALDVPGHAVADALNARDQRFRLARRVVEIRDGLVALEPFRDSAPRAAAARAAAARASDARFASVVEATSIAVAIDHLRFGNEPARPAPRSQPLLSGERDLASDTDWLLEVARDYAMSRTVAAVRREFRPAHAHGGCACGLWRRASYWVYYDATHTTDSSSMPGTSDLPDRLRAQAQCCASRG